MANETTERLLSDLIAAAREMESVAQAAERARWRLFVATLAIAAILLVMMVALLMVALANRETAQTIVSCTTPGGECFKQSQVRTAAVVERILDGQIANTECGDAADIRACVESKLEP